MRRCLLAVVVMAAIRTSSGAEHAIVRPFESEAEAGPANILDGHVLAVLRQRGIEPARPCSDEVFVRRIHLDAIGTLPAPAEVRAFLEDRRPDKRRALIDALLEREEFADYWALKWCDLLRVKAEFPINLWPNAVQAYHRWVRDAIRDNKHYDDFARELLTSSGSNFRVPPVNFYRAVQGCEPSTIAEAVALTLMGDRMTGWPEERRRGMAAFFSRIARKQTAEWKEEIICFDPAPAGAIEAVLPDGVRVSIGPEQDPRTVFARWLVAPENPWFTRNIANRMWAWLMGRGIIHEPDDIRPDKPVVNPALLACLADELIEADYDLRHIYRLIFNSRTYQQSSIPRSDDPQAEALFAHYAVRRLDAEVLIDALCQLSGSGERYTSAIPEPFTFVPAHERTIALADGSITSAFLEMFGRPARDTGLESERSNQPTEAQRLHLLNSTDVQRRIESGWRLRSMVKSARGNRSELIRIIYLNILSRYPTPQELATAVDYFKSSGLKPDEATNDLAWALINSKEFLYRH